MSAEPEWWVIGGSKYQRLRVGGNHLDPCTYGDVWMAGEHTWYGLLPDMAVSEALQFPTEEEAKNWVETTARLTGQL